MITKTEQEVMQELRKPFPADRIEWRLQSCGTKKDGSIWAKCLAYIDNRAAMERLDAVFGANWNQQESFQAIGSAAVCTVTISIIGFVNYPARTVTGSCAVEANGDIDQFKSAASGAMKRAVVNLGVGRYLYDLPEAWAEITDQGAYTGKTKDGTWFKWNPPALPDWAVPAGSPTTGFAPQQDIPAEPTRVAAAAPAAPAASPVASDPNDPWSVAIHFGKNKGKALRDLPENTLQWYLKEWHPKPFGDRQIISKADKALRAALDKILGHESQDKPVQPLSDDEDQVPF